MAKVDRELIKSEQMVYDFLLGSGYPKSSIVLEGELDPRRFIDFLVTDIDTGLPMMMIEVKECSERTKELVVKQAFESLKKYYVQNQSPIKAVAAIYTRGEKVSFLEFIDFTEAVREDDFSRLVRPYSLPSYEIITIGARQKAINKQEKKQEKKIAALKFICWVILPMICLALVLLDAFEIYTLSTLRLTTVGAGAIAMLIPCFKEIRVGEITLKNMIEKKKEETE